MCYSPNSYPDGSVICAFFGVRDKIQAIFENIAPKGQNSGWKTSYSEEIILYKLRFILPIHALMTVQSAL